MEYYYAKPGNISLVTHELFLDDTEFSHVVRVLRKRAGDELSVTDGKGSVFHCVITSISSEKAHCRILGQQYGLFEPKIRLRLYLSPLKSKDRFEFAVEKAVELGVDEIIPVVTRHTVKRADYVGQKAERLKQIILSAMCQSQRCRLPGFLPAITLDALLYDTQFEGNKFVMYEFSDDIDDVAIASGSDSASLLIGPEGGFDESEIEALVGRGWKPKSLGKRKLRAETAVIVAVSNILKKFS